MNNIPQEINEEEKLIQQSNFLSIVNKIFNFFFGINNLWKYYDFVGVSLLILFFIIAIL
jgi:hypothetical protein